jgi:hypothetical protein
VYATDAEMPGVDLDAKVEPLRGSCAAYMGKTTFAVARKEKQQPDLRRRDTHLHAASAQVLRGRIRPQWTGLQEFAVHGSISGRQVSAKNLGKL